MEDTIASATLNNLSFFLFHIHNFRAPLTYWFNLNVKYDTCLIYIVFFASTFLLLLLNLTRLLTRIWSHLLLLRSLFNFLTSISKNLSYLSFRLTRLSGSSRSLLIPTIHYVTCCVHKPSEFFAFRGCGPWVDHSTHILLVAFATQIIIFALLSCGGVYIRGKWLLAILAITFRLMTFYLFNLMLIIQVFFVDVVQKFLKSISVVTSCNTLKSLAFQF